MNQKMLQVYRTRLEGLADTLNTLQQTVNKDQALSMMDSTDLARYRIDRVNQLVRDVLQSQKEQIIIQLLIKCEELTGNGQQELTGNGQQERSVPSDKNNRDGDQGTQFKQEIQKMKEQIAFQRHTAHTVKLQLKAKIQQLHKQLAQKQQLELSWASKIKLAERERENAEQAVADIKNALDREMKEKERLKMEWEIQKMELKKAKELIELKNEQSKGKDQNIRFKVDRIESVKKQMSKLSSELAKNKQTILVIKTAVHEFIHDQLQILREDLKNLKKYIKNSLQKLAQAISSTPVKKQMRGEQLLGRMMELEEVMDNFILQKGIRE